MNFRQKYIKSTGLKIDELTHIHHIDFNRKNNELYNLIHIDRTNHLRFHKLLVLITVINNNIEINNLDFEETLKDKNMLKHLIYFYPKRNTLINLRKIEKKFNKNINIRNKILNINENSNIITEKQNKIIKALSKWKILVG